MSNGSENGQSGSAFLTFFAFVTLQVAYVFGSSSEARLHLRRLTGWTHSSNVASKDVAYSSYDISSGFDDPKMSAHAKVTPLKPAMLRVLRARATKTNSARCTLLGESISERDSH